MFFTYLRRELAGRRRQTAIVAIGMALAIALVMIVNSVASGVRDAQASVLESVYGVGTDLTVSQDPAPPEEGEAAPGRAGSSSARTTARPPATPRSSASPASPRGSAARRSTRRRSTRSPTSTASRRHPLRSRSRT